MAKKKQQSKEKQQENEKQQAIVIKTDGSGFEAARKNIRDLLMRNNITGFTESGVMMVFEALYHEIKEQGCAEDGKISIIGKKRLGELRIILEFKGSMFMLPDSDDEFTPEGRILNTFGDRIDCTYISGYNSIRITTKRKYSNSLLMCLAGIVLAFLIFYPVNSTLSPETMQYLKDTYLFPFETLFGNAILMIGAPVTFFSLLRNLTDAYILSTRNSNIRTIRQTTTISSLIAILLAIGTGMTLRLIFKGRFAAFVGHNDIGSAISIPELISSVVPSNIFEPFASTNPLPLILLAILVTHSLCSQGKYFFPLREAINACYSLFSKMLSLAMFPLPVFTFAATLDILHGRGYKSVLYVTALVLIVLASLVVLEAFYAVRLKLAGINVREFASGLKGLIMENFIINSAIDAVPYNVRYCVRHYKMDRRRLEKYLPVLAQINLEGNCFMITLVALLLVLLSGTPTGLPVIVGIAALVLFMSMGAPNQPGGFVIGILILINYLDLPTFVPLAIFCEVFFGGILSLMNVFGDIVAAAVMMKIEDKKRKAKK